MRVGLMWSVALLLLAGCTSGSGLGQYLVQPADLPEGCELLDPDSDDAQFFAEAFNWSSNPGAIDNEVFEDEHVRSNLVALYDCPSEEVTSVVVGFDSVQAAETFALDWADCEDEEPDVWYFLDGTYFGFIEADEAFAGAIDHAYERIQARTGARDPCTGVAIEE